MAFPTYGKNLLDQYRVQPAPLMRRTEMESGPAKQARIAQRRPVKHPCSYQYTASEYAGFLNWIESEGAQSRFDWEDPQDGVTKQAMLTLGQYEARPVKTDESAPLDWVVNFIVETYE